MENEEQQGESNKKRPFEAELRPIDSNKKKEAPLGRCSTASFRTPEKSSHSVDNTSLVFKRQEWSVPAVPWHIQSKAPLVTRRGDMFRDNSPSTTDFAPSRLHLAATFPRHSGHEASGYPNVMQGSRNTQIVLYKQRSIVAWEERNRELRLRELTPESAQILRNHRMPHCPMCGQVVNLENFTFEASTYFQILQEAIRAFRARENRHGSSWRHTSDGGSSGLAAIRHRQRSRSDLTRSPTQETPNNIFVSQDKAVHDIPPGLLVNGYYNQFFIEERKLGSGAFGQVYLCRHMLDDLFVGHYAIKKIPVGDSKEWLRKMLREVRIRENLHHQNIVAYKHSWLEMHNSSPFCPEIPWLYVLMDYCNEGDLESLITKQQCLGVPLTDMQVWALFLDILEGLNALHRTGILHRDLKPQNILLKSTLELNNRGSPERETRALLADFGTSEILSGMPLRTGEGFTGTVEYTAPELLLVDEKGRFTEPYDFKSDMWSLGMVLHYLCFGYVPFEGKDDPALARQDILDFANNALNGTMRSLPIPSTVSPAPLKSNISRSGELLHLINALLSSNPEDRPSCDELLHHDYIRLLRESTTKLFAARCSFSSVSDPCDTT